MTVSPQKLGAFGADRPVAESSAFSGAGDDSDVLWHE